MRFTLTLPRRAGRLWLCLLLAPVLSFSQADAYRNFPLIAGVGFHNLSLPLQDMGSHFTHPGFFAGTEVSLNQRHSLVQQAQVGAYRNREAGDGLYFLTQTVYRQKFLRQFYGELKLGLGLLRVANPAEVWVFENGAWENVSGGKMQLLVPLGFSLGWQHHLMGKWASPFLTYQLEPALFYNRVVPVHFYSALQLGLRIHL